MTDTLLRALHCFAEPVALLVVTRPLANVLGPRHVVNSKVRVEVLDILLQTDTISFAWRVRVAMPKQGFPSSRRPRVLAAIAERIPTLRILEWQVVMRDLPALSHMTSLEDLTCVMPVIGIVREAALALAPSLRALRLRGVSPPDVAAWDVPKLLRELPKLRTFEIGPCTFSLTDLAQLPPHLTSLTIHGWEMQAPARNVPTFEWPPCTADNVDNAHILHGLGDNCFNDAPNLTRIDLRGLCELGWIGNNFAARDVNLVHLDATGLNALTRIGDKFLVSCGALQSCKISARRLDTIGSHFLCDAVSLTELDLDLPRLGHCGEKFLWGCHSLVVVDLSKSAQQMRSVGDSFCSSLKHLQVCSFGALLCIERIGSNCLAHNKKLAQIDLSNLKSVRECGFGLLDLAGSADAGSAHVIPPHIRKLLDAANIKEATRVQEMDLVMDFDY